MIKCIHSENTVIILYLFTRKSALHSVIPLIIDVNFNVSKIYFLNK